MIPLRCCSCCGAGCWEDCYTPYAAVRCRERGRLSYTRKPKRGAEIRDSEPRRVIPRHGVEVVYGDGAWK